MPSGDTRLARPLLGNGEQLRVEAERRRSGGPFTAPLTVYQAFERLAPQAAQLQADLHELPRSVRAPHVVVEATLWPNFLAASHFPDRLLAETEVYSIGTRQAREVKHTASKVRENVPTKTLLLAGSDRAMDEFLGHMQRRPVSEQDRPWQDLFKFAAVRLPDPERILAHENVPAVGTGEMITWEAVLANVGRTPQEQQVWRDEAFVKWKEFIHVLDGEVDEPFRREVGGLTFVPVALVSERALDARRFNLLRAMRPMPQLRPTPTMLRSAAGTTLSGPPAVVTPLHEGEVAVFDGGVDTTIPALAPYVRTTDLTNEAPQQGSLDHGTMVTTAVVYGYCEGGRVPERAATRIHHYRILPAPVSLGFHDAPYWVLDQIVDVVRRDRLKVVNLSIGPDVCVTDDGEPDRWTAELDMLAEEFGVLFTCAVGNNGRCAADLGLNRVQPPGDMVNALNVGACVSRDGSAPIRRAPYSAIGPGRPGQRVSPTGVAFGGMVDPAPRDHKAQPFVGFGTGGLPIPTQGTSLAAPLALHGVVGLSALLGSTRASPHALRAFAAHFAERTSSKHQIQKLGYGRLREDYSGIWECNGNEVTTMYVDRLVRGELAAFNLPLPEGLPSTASVEIEWTICYMSAVDPRDASEYTRSGIEVTFRPHARRHSVSDPATRRPLGVFDMEQDADAIAALAATRAIHISEAPASAGFKKGPRDEAALRGSGKWETLVRGRAKLTAGELFHPRLDLGHLARDAGVLSEVGSDVPALPIVMLVSLRTDEGIELYSLTRSEYTVLVPVIQTVPVLIEAA